MLSTPISPALAAALLISLVPKAFAGKVVPCAVGSGNDNGCSYCEDDKGINVTPWSSATAESHFDMPNAASKTGGGYDVWWNIQQPDPGCRIIITEPYSTDKGSTDSRLSGNVILSAGYGGCYFAHVGSRSVAAGFCCGSGDCGAAGAAPHKKKRELLPSRIMRGLPSDTSDLEVRSWRNPNPEDPKPAPPPPAVQCSAPTSDGDTYTKAGPQQIDGQSLNCNGGESCAMSPDMSVSASTSLMNEESTTHTDSQGFSYSMTAGFMFIGPTATVTVGYNMDWSNAVTEAASTTSTHTVTKSLTLSIGLVPGANFNLWFTPTLRCQSFKITCNGVDQKIEKCTPVLDGNGNPTGDHGVMTVA